MRTFSTYLKYKTFYRKNSKSAINVHMMSMIDE